MEEQHWEKFRWAIYRLMGSVSVEEIMCNQRLVASFARLERLLKRTAA